MKANGSSKLIVFISFWTLECAFLLFICQKNIFYSENTSWISLTACFCECSFNSCFVNNFILFVLALLSHTVSTSIATMLSEHVNVLYPSRAAAYGVHLVLALHECHFLGQGAIFLFVQSLEFPRPVYVHNAHDGLYIMYIHVPIRRMPSVHRSVLRPEIHTTYFYTTHYTVILY